jgi:hypothetical protein
MQDGEKMEIPLGEMIETLRQELQSAQAQGSGQPIAFEIDKVELELQMVVSRKKSGDGKIAFWVLSVGGGVENRGETTHTIKLSLSPVSSRTGGRVTVRGEAEQPLSRK